MAKIELYTGTTQNELFFIQDQVLVTLPILWLLTLNSKINFSMGLVASIYLRAHSNFKISFLVDIRSKYYNLGVAKI